MEKRLSYTIVGTFVIAITLALFSFLYWITKYGDNAIEHHYYKTYFTESVSGLSLDSPVKLRGVEIGRVKSISISEKNSEEVKVLLEINKGTPIKKDTFALLDSQGITGLKHVELEGGSKDSPLLMGDDKTKIPTIPSKKSVIAMLYDSGESMIEKLNVISEKANKILSEQNVQYLSNIIQNLSRTTTFIDENKHRLTEMFDQISLLKASVETNFNAIEKDFKSFKDSSSDLIEHTKKFEDKLTPTFDKLGRASDQLGDASDMAKLFFRSVQKELDSGAFNLSDIVERNLQILNDAAFSIKDTSLKLDDVIEEFKQSPSDIFYKVGTKIPGPGERHE
ncbi:MlaD family protein [Sulfurospirillum sp. 1612]|uniref:MlaD family protein n=1 Tax=Sulfurospirillum sp. 1612 TaxID=3094835 RepID=UPI002F95326F